ncbi:MAG: hypothetical protein QNL04_10670 [SAR324 cluster bacterium]|nr:hypothetical protein [SAR324 cluster bacterium]
MTPFYIKPLPRNLIGLLLIFLFTVTFCPRKLEAKPNYYEVRIVKAEVKKSFENFISMWKEELYFDMYDHGQIYSRRLMGKSEFAQRMVDLPWKPSAKEMTIEEIEVDYRSFTLIRCVLEMENKTNPSRKVEKRYYFHVILEKGKWKFDLGQIIRVPFVGKIIDYEAEKKAKEAALKKIADEKAAAEAAVKAAAEAAAAAALPGAAPVQPAAAPIVAPAAP